MYSTINAITTININPTSCSPRLEIMWFSPIEFFQKSWILNPQKIFYRILNPRSCQLDFVDAWCTNGQANSHEQSHINLSIAAQNGTKQINQAVWFCLFFWCCFWRIWWLIDSWILKKLNPESSFAKTKSTCHLTASSRAMVMIM